MSCTSPKTVARTTVPFVVPSRAFQKLLEVRDRLLHHLGRLQDERQDQLAASEAIADVLHGGQQNLVEHVDGRSRCSASSIFASMPSLRRRRIA